MPTVTANTTCSVTIDGMPVGVAEGQEFADDHPIVAEFGWLFEPPVEQATAAPGEKRAARKPRKAPAKK